MKRGKRFYEKENFIIYIGTAIFFVLAISVGIVIYMTTKANSNIGKENGKSITEKIENLEDASSNIGKTIEEQEKIAEQEDSKEISEKTESKIGEKEEEKIISNEDDTKKENEETEPANIEETTEENKTIVQEKTTEEKKPITFTNPTDGEIIAEFAQENLIYSETLKEWVTHTGIDMKADKTSVIKASADGAITSIINDPRYGLTIVMAHDDGYETVYSNLLTAEFVVEGEEVKQGQTIGTAGNTASFESGMESHLHFEILKDGEYLNPSIYLK